MHLGSATSMHLVGADENGGGSFDHPGSRARAVPYRAAALHNGHYDAVRFMRWHRIVAAGVLVSGLVAWRVVQDDQGSRVHSGAVVLLDGVVPARAGITLPPGTSIGAGFEVAEGSYLLGSALPYLYSSTTPGHDTIQDEGFQAWLLVTEPIGDVIDRYRTQAVEAGFEMTPIDCEGTAVLICSTTCELRCGAPHQVDYRHGQGLEIRGVQGSGDQVPTSHLSINYRQIGDPPYPGDDSVPPSDPPPPSQYGALPEEWPPLPEVGEPIDSFNDFEVASGTVLLAHGLGSIGWGETTAIFEVVGDLETVIDRFTSQPEYPEHDPYRFTLTRDGHRYDDVSWTDGQSQSLEFYDPPDGPTILVLTSYVSD